LLANILTASKPAKFQILKIEDAAEGHNNGRLKEGNIIRNESLEPFRPEGFAS